MSKTASRKFFCSSSESWSGVPIAVSEGIDFMKNTVKDQDHLEIYKKNRTAYRVEGELGEKHVKILYTFTGGFERLDHLFALLDEYLDELL